MLQSYAMCEVVNRIDGATGEQLCINVMVSLHKGLPLKERLRAYCCAHSWSREILDRLYYPHVISNECTRKFKKFANMIPHSRYYGTQKAIQTASVPYHALIAGSDQIWNPCFDAARLRLISGLGFAHSPKRKLSYAASIGAAGAAVGKEDLYREILSGLDFISVREKSAQAFLQPLTDKPVTVVLDPTLLLAEREWDKLAVGPGHEQPHLFAYFLNERGNRHNGQLHQIADALNLPLRCISDELEIYLRPGTADKQILDAGPREFVGEIRDAEIVFTNSFHGAVFAILLHKPFWAFKRNRDGDKSSMNSRIADLLADFGLEDRLLEDGELPTAEKLREPIDYDSVDHILEEKRAFSLNWLKTALEGI